MKNQKKTTGLRHAAYIGAFTLAFALTCGVGVLIPQHAYAKTSAELKAELKVAQSRMDDLYNQAEAANEKVNATTVKLENTQRKIASTKKSIDQKQKELEKIQKILAKRVVASYKSGGGSSLFTLILDSENIDQLISSIHYANQVAAQDEANIQKASKVKAALSKQKAALEASETQQKQLLKTQKKAQAELASKASAAQEYVNSLSAEVRKALAAEEKARQEKAAREAAAALAAAQRRAAANARAAQESRQHPVTHYTAPTTSRQNNNQNANQNSNQNNNNNSNSGSTNGSSGSSQTNTTVNDYRSPSSNAGWRWTVINAAASMVGSRYVWAASDPYNRTFDCSGLVMYAYSCAGFSVPHSSESLAAYCNKPISQVQPGDIVWRPGHVGIAVNSTTTIEAFNPSMGVGYGSTSSFYSCGSPA